MVSAQAVEQENTRIVSVDRIVVPVGRQGGVGVSCRRGLVQETAQDVQQPLDGDDE